MPVMSFLSKLSTLSLQSQTALILTSIVLIFGICILSTGLYNIYVHPLKDIPGPPWSRFSELSKLLVLICHDLPTLTLRYHEKYGERSMSSVLCAFGLAYS